MKNCDLLFTENGEISKQNKNPLKHSATFLLKNVNANRPSGKHQVSSISTANFFDDNSFFSDL